MSGHSKWATIHRQKELKDAKRGQQFTKVANAISVAVKEGGGIGDPEVNFKLRLLIEKARSVNMPKENIERAIQKGKGVSAGGLVLEEVLYEGYGPGGVGVLVEAVTDNKQRTAQVIKNVFDRSGGSLAGPGAVAFQFQKVGLLEVAVKQPADEQMLSLIDMGAQDVEEVEGILGVEVSLHDFEAFKEKVLSAGYETLSSEPAQRPATLIPLNSSESQKVLNLIEALEELDDVQRVWTNIELA